MRIFSIPETVAFADWKFLKPKVGGVRFLTGAWPRNIFLGQAPGFFGFKLHVIINDKAELVRVKLTQGNVDDRTVVPLDGSVPSRSPRR